MSEYRVVQDYPDPPERVWCALTDPAIVPLWTSTGQGGKPVGFAAVVGTRFKFVGKPTVGWNGVVDCEVLEVRELALLRFTWRGGQDDDHMAARAARWCHAPDMRAHRFHRSARLHDGEAPRVGPEKDAEGRASRRAEEDRG